METGEDISIRDDVPYFHTLSAGELHYTCTKCSLHAFTHASIMRILRIIPHRPEQDFYTEKLFVLIFTIVFFNLGKNVSL